MKNRYEVDGDYVTIFVYFKGNYIATTIDRSSFGKADSMEGTWGYSMNSAGKVYIWCRVRNKNIYLHRLITDCPDDEEVDHKDGNTLNNRLDNLKVCHHMVNMCNRKDNTSGVPCVRWRADADRWIARVHFDRKTTHLGYFECKYEAGREVSRFKIKNGLPVSRTPISIGGDLDGNRDISGANLR